MHSLTYSFQFCVWSSPLQALQRYNCSMRNTDYTGQTFGKWTVLRKDEERSSADTFYWLCKCECGTERSVAASNLRRGKSTSCGCRNDLKAMIGKNYGKWRVIRIAEEKKLWGKSFVVCVCECGAQKEIEPHKLRHGKSQSCGCQRSRNNTQAIPFTLTFAQKTATFAEWAKITGISRETLVNRYKYGWPIEHILLTPPRATRRKLAMEAADQEADCDEKLMDTLPAITE